MTPDHLRALLERLQSGDLEVAAAMEELRALPYRDIGVATVDHHRALRQGVPEVIFGEGKTAAELCAIAEEMVGAGHNLLITRLSADKAKTLASHQPGLRYVERARLARLDVTPPAARPCAPVALLCAGTSDIGVAEEAAETLGAVGLEPARIYDVGVAGIHRLFGRSDELAAASAAIVIAGMEGALPSVVGGLISQPIVAVPTSVGYGTALGGFTALMSMLTSCATGVTVVNIDNGFGAAMAVHRMLPRAEGTGGHTP
ncbi:MAG: nickel pincer cofactor biosynthesis protein LarB [Deltaproteobacteria bacterium]|nr:nickel pincer cofactor biosynthesis protein LarB [Deltaproteobacteria bacterium]